MASKTDNTDNTDNSNTTSTFIPLLNFEDDYEILNEYPYTIRRIKDSYEISECKSNGYILVHLNSKSYCKHVLIAKQFIENDDPEHKIQVDHINHDRSDNHIENLRWITPSNNQRNKSLKNGVKYEFIDELPDDYIDVDTYTTRNDVHEFGEKEYYYAPSTDKFYYFNGSKYRILRVNNYNGTLCVRMTDINKRYVSVCYTKFKVQYDLLD